MMNNKKAKLIRHFIAKNPDFFVFGSEHWDIKVVSINNGNRLNFCSFSRFGTKTHFPVAFHRPITKSVNLFRLETPETDE
jgi:hypothetical protein